MININGVEWRILIVDPFHPGLQRSDTGYSLGVCDNNKKTIYITNDLKPQFLWRVISHELTHAAMFSYGVELSYEQEEMFADLVATYGKEIVYITNLLFHRIKKIRGEVI